MRILGTIIATEDSPSTTDFSFVVSGSDAIVKKGQYVQTSLNGEQIFGFVSEIIRSNLYFERPDSVVEYEKIADMATNFPVGDREHLVAQVRILGNHNNGKFTRTFSPPKPGTKVTEAEEGLLKKFIGFHDNGIHLGNLQHHEIEAKLSMTRMLQKHLAILAMSGAGKSHLASVMMEELLSRSAEEGRIAVIVIDIHGEYAGFAEDENFRKNIKLVDAADIRIPLKKVTPEMFEEWLTNLSIPQKEVLRQSLHSLRDQFGKGECYGMKDLVFEIDQNDSVKEETKNALKRSLGELRRYQFVSKEGENPNLHRDIMPGSMNIIDFSSVDSLRKKQIIVAYLARKLFKLRKNNKIPPFLFVVEEAHNFARENAEAYDAVSRGIIETIAREGRKFGASLCLISQRPVNLSTTALSQCNTHIILRITNPNDLQHIEKSSEGIDARVSKNITSLKTGEAIIVGEAVNYPVFLSIRQRKSLKRERGIPLDEQAKSFEASVKKRAEQVEAFL